MRLPDDDELYEVDQTYLGPPGRYIAVMRHRTIFVFLVVCPMALVLIKKLGIGLNLLTVGLVLVGSVALSQSAADRLTTERSLMDLLTTWWHDLSARRASPHTLTARAGDGFRRVADPAGGIGRWSRRHADDADAGATTSEGES